MSAYDESIISPFETFDELSFLDTNGPDDSMRVIYEDPRQQEEKKRLMSLLKIGGVGTSLSEGISSGNEGTSKIGASGKGASRARRSSRIAGF